MKRCSVLTALALIVVALAGKCRGITGKYVECPPATSGPAPVSPTRDDRRKNAVMGWKVEAGTLDGAKLDGLSVVAIVDASDTSPGADRRGQGGADRGREGQRAQRDALVKFARQTGGDLLKNVLKWSRRRSPSTLHLQRRTAAPS